MRGEGNKIGRAAIPAAGITFAALQALPYYTRLAETRQALATALQSRYDRLAIVRLLVFFGVVAALIVAWNTGLWAGAITTLLTLPALYFLIRYHRNLGKQAAGAQVQYQLAASELRALDYDLSGRPDGARYTDPAHPYAVDLDIFGRRSLFQFINRTVTAIGSDALADQLAHPATHEVAEGRRREGISLAGDPDWCIDFRTHGAGLEDKSAYAERLREWVERTPVVTDGLTKAMLWAAPLLTVVGGWVAFTQSPWQLGLLFFLPAVYLMRKYGEAAAAEHAYTAHAGRILAGYQVLLRQVEERYGRLPGGAAAAVRELSYAISQLDIRYNPFVFILEVTGLWSLQWLHRLDRWRAAHREHLSGWLTELAEVDARVSWATLRFNQAACTEPVLTTDRVLEGHGMAHPLLSPGVRVANDISLSTDGHIHLVTGSNMAGKSTWLRTVGINIVLARAGGPVFADYLRLAPLQVWTSMRTQDDLSESTSSFYAELKRLKAIIEAVSDPNQQVFFLLDEILKGTNSRDRHTGSRALIRQLIRERGAGIIATHDLELAVLEKEAGSRVENYAMEVKTENGLLAFDYKLHRGVSRSFNATALMARMGIEIDPEDIKLTHD